MTRAVQHSRWIGRLIEKALRCGLIKAVVIADILKTLVVSHLGALLRLFVLLWNHTMCSRLNLIHLTLVHLDITQFSLYEGSSRRLFSGSNSICSSSVVISDMLLSN